MNAKPTTQKPVYRRVIQVEVEVATDEPESKVDGMLHDWQMAVLRLGTVIWQSRFPLEEVELGVKEVKEGRMGPDGTNGTEGAKK